MTTTQPPAHLARSRPPRHLARMTPGQHGAWAFLALPVVLGAAHTGVFDLLPLLAVTWLAAYPAGWAASGLATSRHPQQFASAFYFWAPVALAAGTTLLWWRPWLGWVAVPYLALYQVSLHHARHRSERSLAHDLLVVAECAAMVPVTVGVADGHRNWLPPVSAMTSSPVAVLTLACALALTGSVLHVKSLVRERDDPRWARASGIFAVLSVVAVAVATYAAGTSPLLTGAFLVLALRALLVPRGWRPVRVGLVELAALTAVAAAALAGG